MLPRRRAGLARVLVLLVCAGLASCTLSPYSSMRYLPDPPSERVRAQLGRIGVVFEDTLTPPTIESPPSGSAAVGIGAGQGALATIGAGVDSGSPLGAAMGIFLSPLGMLVGAVYGATGAEGEAAAAAARTRIEAAFQACPPEQMLLEVLLRRAASDARRELRALDVRWEHQSAPARLEAARAAGCDSVLILRIDAVGLVAQEQDVNPALAFELYVTCRLLRAADGAVLHELPLHWTGGGANFVRWSVGDARDVRAALAGAAEETAERMVDELFLLHLGPETSSGPDPVEAPHAAR